MSRISEELADVAVFVLMMAHDLELDLNAAILAKLKANAERYPVSEYYGSAKKAPH